MQLQHQRWTDSKERYRVCTMMGHLQDCSSLHDPPGRASSLGRPNPVSYPVSWIRIGSRHSCLHPFTFTSLIDWLILFSLPTNITYLLFQSYVSRCGMFVNKFYRFFVWNVICYVHVCSGSYYRLDIEVYDLRLSDLHYYYYYYYYLYM